MDKESYYAESCEESLMILNDNTPWDWELDEAYYEGPDLKKKRWKYKDNPLYELCVTTSDGKKHFLVRRDLENMHDILIVLCAYTHIIDGERGPKTKGVS